MRIVTFILIVFFCNNIFTSSSSPVIYSSYKDTDSILISLGYNCYGATNVQKYGRRIAAYPFDWTLLPLSDLNLILKNDFKDLFNIDYLQQTASGAPFYESIMNTIYNINFVHDFYGPDYKTVSTEWKSLIPQVKAKYDRRIKRFYDLANHKGKIYFLRIVYGVDPLNNPLIFKPEDVIALKEELYKKFPNVDFELILIFFGCKFPYNWNDKKIREFYIHERNPPYWTEPLSQFIEDQFFKIFELLGISRIGIEFTGYDVFN